MGTRCCEKGGGTCTRKFKKKINIKNKIACTGSIFTIGLISINIFRQWWNKTGT
jgi:hypothetical protein